MFTSSHHLGSYRNLSLERITRDSYGLPADIWACGLVLFEMPTGEPLFAAKEEKGLTLETLRERIFQGFDRGKFPTLSPEVADLIASLMNQDSDTIITISKALEDPWLSKNPHCSSSDLRALFSSKNKQNTE